MDVFKSPPRLTITELQYLLNYEKDLIIVIAIIIT